MRIVNEILLKIVDELKIKFLKSYQILTQLVKNQKQIMKIVENMRLKSINSKIRTFKNEKILNF